MKKKILLFTNQSDTVIHFRKELIKFLIDAGDSVVVVTGDIVHKNEIVSLGVEFECLPFSNRSRNPLSFLKLQKAFAGCLKKHSPDVVMTFQIKPNIVGGIVSRKLKVNSLFCMVEGLGDPFQPRSLFDKLVRSLVVLLYRTAFKKAKRVFFLNKDDVSVFVKRRIVPEEKVVLLDGIGIDTGHYLYSEELTEKKNVVMLSRLIRNKGIFEYCEIAKKVRSQRKDIYFYLYGRESQLTALDISSYIDNKDVIYKGETQDAESAYRSARIYVSTSYREGFPRTILEAYAIGTPVFATDVAGNNAAVISGETGLLIEPKNIDAFSEALLKYIDDGAFLEQLRKTARKKCEEVYNSNVINQRIVSIILS